MRMRRIVAIVVLIASAISLALALRPTKSIAAATPTMSSDDQPVVEWIGANAVRLRTPEAGNGFADMQPLKKMIGNARIVSLGEATHGTREFFQLKHRMLEFLASEMGFTIFSIEANMPEAYRLNDYVLNGNGDPAKLIKGMYFWTWDTQEVLDMVLWMREFNKSGKGRVQFTGFDMQTPNVAADIVRDFVDKNDTEYADALRKASDVAKAAPHAGGASFGVATATFPIQAAAGKRILLVDADLDRRTLSQLRGASAGAGLFDLIEGRAMLSSMVLTETQTGLNFLPAGNASRRETRRPKPGEIVHKLIEPARNFDFVIIDCGSVLTDAYVQPFADVVDDVLFVVRAGTTRSDDILRAFEALRMNSRKVRGTVLTGATEDA